MIDWIKNTARQVAYRAITSDAVTTGTILKMAEQFSRRDFLKLAGETLMIAPTVPVAKLFNSENKQSVFGQAVISEAPNISALPQIESFSKKIGIQSNALTRFDIFAGSGVQEFMYASPLTDPDSNAIVQEERLFMRDKNQILGITVWMEMAKQIAYNPSVDANEVQWLLNYYHPKDKKDTIEVDPFTGQKIRINPNVDLEIILKYQFNENGNIVGAAFQPLTDMAWHFGLFGSYQRHLGEFAIDVSDTKNVAHLAKLVNPIPTSVESQIEVPEYIQNIKIVNKLAKWKDSPEVDQNDFPALAQVLMEKFNNGELGKFGENAKYIPFYFNVNGPKYKGMTPALYPIVGNQKDLYGMENRWYFQTSLYKDKSTGDLIVHYLIKQKDGSTGQFFANFGQNFDQNKQLLTTIPSDDSTYKMVADLSSEESSEIYWSQENHFLKFYLANREKYLELYQNWANQGYVPAEISNGKYLVPMSGQGGIQKP